MKKWLIAAWAGVKKVPDELEDELEPENKF